MPVNDSNLKTLLARVPTLSIIVLEDVKNANLPPREGAASLSALLDTIDSIGDAYLTIMITRYIELVDGVLMEPSRVAIKAEFGLTDNEIIARLFRFASCRGLMNASSAQMRSVAVLPAYVL